ncbi:hypothetical protein [Streptomyces sp. NBC_01235]|uniref:hypothetical protein n=1 Tax=Streptomyces sp. NBC_01235 TaxID=2903788 RepID=UPI002E0D58FC|nr:hypothetical protein OG289_15915 [Streptomyces sp. NBC_01235]
MTQHAIAGLLADAADEVDIGIAPTQALIRGGRRRRARRWAVAAATVLVVAGSTGALAMTGLPGGDGERVAPPAAQRSGTTAPGLLAPHRTVLGSGIEQGQKWQVSLDVWTAPANETEAAAQLRAMREYGDKYPTGGKPSNMVGNTTYFFHRTYGPHSTQEWGNGPHGKRLPPGKSMESTANSFPGADGPRRLVIGHVVKTAKQVTCLWKDGTKTELVREPANGTTNTDKPALHSTEGAPTDWFACLAPQGTESDSVTMTGDGNG